MTLVGVLAAATAAVTAILSLAPALPDPARGRRPVWLRARARRDSGAAAVPIMQATHAGLRAGLPLVTALRTALEPHDARTRGPFERVVRALELNASVDDAIALARDDVADRRLITALDAIGLAAGADLPASRAAALIASVADRLSFEANVREEVDARASGVRAQIAILALVVPCFALYLLLTMPGLAATMTSPLGTHLLVPAAVLLEVAGIVVSRSIVHGLEL